MHWEPLMVNKPTPHWLIRESLSKNFNRVNVLNESLYYPGCNVDWRPIEELLGWCYSFIYVDYEMTKDLVIYNFERSNRFKIISIQDIPKSKLQENPTHLVKPELRDFRESRPGDSYFSHNQEYQRKMERNQRVHPPFALWIVFESKDEWNSSSKRGSLLYICGEGVATYNALYNSNEIRPIAIALHLAEGGYGGNWTNFELNNGILERTVMSNKAGIPDYLFTSPPYNPPYRLQEYDPNSNTHNEFWTNYITRPNRANDIHPRSQEFDIWCETDLETVLWRSQRAGI